MIRDVIVDNGFQRFKQKVLVCDRCNVEMIQKNIVLTSYPPQYLYYCPMCKKQEISREQYSNINEDEEKYGRKKI